MTQIITEEAHDYELRIAHLKIALKEALAERDTWKALAEMHRGTIYELRGELKEHIDAFNDLYEKTEGV